MLFGTAEIELQFNHNKSEADSIRRCLNMLYSTRAGTVPMDREFGLNWSFVEKPLPVAEDEFALDVIVKTAKYEPRVKVEKVEFDFDEEEGKMIPKIYLTKGDG